MWNNVSPVTQTRGSARASSIVGEWALRYQVVTAREGIGAENLLFIRGTGAQWRLTRRPDIGRWRRWRLTRKRAARSRSQLRHVALYVQTVRTSSEQQCTSPLSFGQERAGVL